jgi:hypothetical protein
MPTARWCWNSKAPWLPIHARYAACSHFGNERVIESIFVTMAWHSRQTFSSNIRFKALSQSVEPDALLLQGFHQICRSDT